MSKRLHLLHTCTYNALFRKESKLSYGRTLEAIYNLADEAKNLNIDLDENACDCEGDVTIQDILTGAYNFVLKLHQDSAWIEDSDWIEDRVLAVLDGIALPDKIEDNTSEKDVYNLLFKKRTFTTIDYKDSSRNCWRLEHYLESYERVVVRDIENGDDEYERYTYRYMFSREGNVVIRGHIDFQSDYDVTEKIMKHIANELQGIMIGMAVETVRNMVSVEVGFAYDNGSWNTDFVTVPIEIFQKEDHNALINYINEAGLVPDGAVGVFLYNWGTGELE